MSPRSYYWECHIWCISDLKADFFGTIEAADR